MSNSNRSRRHYSTEQKVALLQRHLVDKEPVSKICDEEELQPSVFYQWLRQAFANLGGALVPEAANEASKRERELAARNKEIEAKLVKEDNSLRDITPTFTKLKRFSVTLRTSAVILSLQGRISYGHRR